MHGSQAADLQLVPRRVRTWGRLLGLVLGLLLACALVEVAGRLLLDFEPLPGWAQRFNREVGFELRPYQTYTYASADGEFENVVEANSRGLHDVEHSLAKPDGVFRILLLADSYAHAREVPIEQNFARQLEDRLNETAPDGVSFEVINAGHFGLGTTQEYLYYVVEGWRYQPDLVLLGFYVGNDVMDNHAPLVQAWNQMDSMEFPYFAPDCTLHQPGKNALRWFLSWLRQNSYVVHTLSAALAGTGTPERVVVGGGDPVPQAALRVPLGAYAPPDETWRDAWRATDCALAALKSSVEQHGSRLAVFVIPDRRQVYTDELESTVAQLADFPTERLELDRPTQTVRSLLEARNIPQFNLLDVFRPAGERLYFALDGHFNPAGHRLVAASLADWLRADGSVPAVEPAAE